MIKFLINVFCLTFCLTLFSQNNLGSANDISRVVLTPFVFDKLGNMNDDVKNALSEIDFNEAIADRSNTMRKLLKEFSEGLKGFEWIPRTRDGQAP